MYDKLFVPSATCELNIGEKALQKYKLAILLATYNGEKYLRPLLDSLFSQQEQEWDLLISDDCSKDATHNILNEYVQRYPNRVILTKNERAFGSAKSNFFHLLRQAEGYEYLMFCDQDDVWKPEKVNITLRAMQELEHGDIKTPCLVHTDLTVARADLSVLHESFMESSMLDPSRCALKQLVIQNIVTGCTMMINAALREKVLLPADENSIRMHDAWCALWASAIGRIGYVKEKTILYRQHGTNVVGAKNVNSLRYLLHYLCHGKQNRQALVEAERQAGVFLNAAKDVLNDEQKQLLSDYSTMRKKGKINRVRIIFKHGIWKTGWRRCVGEIIQI